MLLLISSIVPLTFVCYLHGKPFALVTGSVFATLLSNLAPTLLRTWMSVFVLCSASPVPRNVVAVPLPLTALPLTLSVVATLLIPPSPKLWRSAAAKNELKMPRTVVHERSFLMSFL